jgi:hypothetical protein
MIDTLDNYLSVHFSVDPDKIKKFSFPKFRNFDTLRGVSFKFELFENGKLIEGAGLEGKNNGANYFRYNDWMKKDLVFYTDSEDIRYLYSESFHIPYYALKNLKAGNHILELRISQDHFFSANKLRRYRLNEKRDTIVDEYRNFVKLNLLNWQAKFKFSMPEVYRTNLYGLGIELRNDSVYSPNGMDNTIWQSSYPDIYWTVDYPSDNFYCSSDYQKSTSLYTIKDTFCLYHYAPNDSIKIGVWDHDNLSRDDYISYKTFSLKKFPQNAPLNFAFENVRNFQMRVVKEGVTNK